MDILLVIDIQQKYLNHYNPNLIERVNARIDEAIINDIPIIYVRNTGLSGNDSIYGFAEDLKIASDCIFKKHFPNAFTNKEFEDFLERLNIDTINVIGVDGRCCVYYTVMAALKRNYKVKLFLDAIEAQNDKFFIKELPSMEKAGANIVYT